MNGPEYWGNRATARVGTTAGGEAIHKQVKYEKGDVRHLYRDKRRFCTELINAGTPEVETKITFL